MCCITTRLRRRFSRRGRRRDVVLFRLLVGIKGTVTPQATVLVISAQPDDTEPGGDSLVGLLLIVSLDDDSLDRLVLRAKREVFDGPIIKWHPHSLPLQRVGWTDGRTWPSVLPIQYAY